MNLQRTLLILAATAGLASGQRLVPSDFIIVDNYGPRNSSNLVAVYNTLTNVGREAVLILDGGPWDITNHVTLHPDWPVYVSQDATISKGTNTFTYTEWVGAGSLKAIYVNATEIPNVGVLNFTNEDGTVFFNGIATTNARQETHLNLEIHSRFAIQEWSAALTTNQAFSRWSVVTYQGNAYFATNTIAQRDLGDPLPIPGQAGDLHAVWQVFAEEGPQGLTGSKGDKGDPGAGVVQAPSYNGSQTYASNDLVRYNEQIWASLTNLNLGKTPSDFVGSYWEVAVASGTSGSVLSNVVIYPTYDAAQVYTSNNLTSFQGSLWLVTNTAPWPDITNLAPSSTSSYWIEWVAKGDTGATGPAGDDGEVITNITQLVAVFDTNAVTLNSPSGETNLWQYESTVNGTNRYQWISVDDLNLSGGTVTSVSPSVVSNVVVFQNTTATYLKDSGIPWVALVQTNETRTLNFTNGMVLVAAPTDGSHAATKAYVDTGVSAAVTNAISVVEESDGSNEQTGLDTLRFEAEEFIVAADGTGRAKVSMQQIGTGDNRISSIGIFRDEDIVMRFARKDTDTDFVERYFYTDPDIYPANDLGDTFGIGIQATHTGDRSVFFGADTDVASDGVAIGYKAKANVRGISIGANAGYTYAQTDSIAIGYDADLYDSSDTILIGNVSAARLGTRYGVFIGNIIDAGAVGSEHGVHIGYNADPYTPGHRAVAVGSHARAGTDAIALGSYVENNTALTLRAGSNGRLFFRAGADVTATSTNSYVRADYLKLDESSGKATLAGGSAEVFLDVTLPGSNYVLHLTYATSYGVLTNLNSSLRTVTNFIIHGTTSNEVFWTLHL